MFSADAKIEPTSNGSLHPSPNLANPLFRAVLAFVLGIAAALFVPYETACADEIGAGFGLDQTRRRPLTDWATVYDPLAGLDRGLGRQTFGPTTPSRPDRMVSNLDWSSTDPYAPENLRFLRPFDLSDAFFHALGLESIGAPVARETVRLRDRRGIGRIEPDPRYVPNADPDVPETPGPKGLLRVDRALSSRIEMALNIYGGVEPGGIQIRGGGIDFVYRF